jgi:hypothetical protein
MQKRLFMVSRALVESLPRRIALDARLAGRRPRVFSPGNILLLLGMPPRTTPPLRGTPPQRGMSAVRSILRSKNSPLSEFPSVEGWQAQPDGVVPQVVSPASGDSRRCASFGPVFPSEGGRLSRKHSFWGDDLAPFLLVMASCFWASSQGPPRPCGAPRPRGECPLFEFL